MTDEERQAAIARGGQIFLTNCTACHNFAGRAARMPSGGYAPTLQRRRRASTSTRPCSPARSRCRSSPTATCRPEDKRDVIAYLESLEETPEYGGFGLGGLGPVTEGLFAWLVGIGVLVGFGDVDRRPQRPDDQDERAGAKRERRQTVPA